MNWAKRRSEFDDQGMPKTVKSSKKFYAARRDVMLANVLTIISDIPDIEFVLPAENDQSTRDQVKDLLIFSKRALQKIRAGDGDETKDDLNFLKIFDIILPWIFHSFLWRIPTKLAGF